jgi:hypothetical protein
MEKKHKPIKGSKTCQQNKKQTQRNPHPTYSKQHIMGFLTGQINYYNIF